jgi:ketosteroid isomerase-like protein
MKINILFLLLITACSTTNSTTDLESLKTEVMQAEKEFNDVAEEEGIAKAFAAFAAENAVIQRRGELIKGQAAISSWYENNSNPDATLSWEPDFIDVSQSGDLAYTYGKFEFSYPDSTGTKITSSGTFHSVWKRQADGSWKFVWD